MSAYADTILAALPVAYWRMGEPSGTTLVDSGPNALNGTYGGSGITLGTPGAITDHHNGLPDPDTAATFDGTSDPASVPDNNLLDLGDGPLSIEFWVKRSATQGSLQTLVNKGTNGYHVRFRTNNTIALFKSGNATVIVASSGAITDQLWHHVVITKVGADARLYVDGKDVSAPGTDQTLANTPNLLRFGFLSPASERFPGSLDELAIYSRVLESYEVAHHLRAGHPSGFRMYAPRGFRGDRRFEVPR